MTRSSRRALGGALALAAVWLCASCGEDGESNTLSGSEGEVRSLSFDRVEATLFRSAAREPPDQLRIQYVADSGDKPAVLVVDLEGIEPGASADLDLLQELEPSRPRGTFYWLRAGQQHSPDLDRATLRLSRWEDRAGATLEASFFLLFAETGRDLEGEVSTELRSSP